jgi:hypothetical protein
VGQGNSNFGAVDVVFTIRQFSFPPPNPLGKLHNSKILLFEMPPTAVGRVGPKPAKLSVSETSDGHVRIDCANNSQWWMEIDVKNATVAGRGMETFDLDGKRVVGTSLEPTSKMPSYGLVLTKKHGVLHNIRVDDEAEPSFWLEISF